MLEIQESDGWLAEERLREFASEAGVPLHRLESLSTFYTHFRREPPRGVPVEVCRDLSCQLAGGRAARKRLETELGPGENLEIREVSCLGRCDQAPAASVRGRTVSTLDPADVLRASALPQSEEAAIPRSWEAMQLYDSPQQHYSTLRQMLQRDPSELSACLEAAELRGMGGAAFPTGRKWSLVADTPDGPKHVITNADESEPGSFKDREVLASLPHLVIEGMALAGYCIGAKRGTVFIRHEYEPERRAVEAAIEEARQLGALGDRVFGSEFDFDVEIFVSPGGYILGEETALLECLEDRRGEPRN
ncbi:MAG: NAD(P)H-dependent oxidoreductase subunit E, partial [Myxococcota bacterium]